MRTYCSKCGTAYEVTKSQNNSYIFCLNCDQFFKVTDKQPASSSQEDIKENAKKSRFYKKSTKNNEVKAKFSLIIKLKKSIKDFFESFPKPVNANKNSSNKVLELPEKTSNSKVEQLPAKALLDDFLGPESDFMDKMDAAPTEYLNFLSSGINNSPAERLKANARSNSQKISVSEKQKYNNITIK